MSSFVLLSMVVVLTSCVRKVEEGAAQPAPKPARTVGTTPAKAEPPRVASPKAETQRVASPKAEPQRVASPKAAASQPPPAPLAPAQEAPPEKPKAPPKISYSATHDEEVKQIFDLTSKGRWEEAETLANALYARDPQDQAAQRLRTWVQQQGDRQRAQAMEDKIREIDAKNSVFNPTLKGIVTEKKDRGLPPRKDVRDMIEQIESTPYIPETFGKTNYTTRGILFDFESRQGRMAKILDKEVNVVLDNATLEQIIFNVGQAEGINFVADKSLPAFQQKLSVNMQRAKLSNFLKYISRNLDLQFQVGDDLIWIVDAKNKDRVMEETRFYRLRKGFLRPAERGPPEVQRTSMTQNNITTVTELEKMAKFVNDLAPKSPSLERAITNFFGGSKYLIDYERNIVVAKGTPEQLEVMERIIEEFDKPIQQVFIEARFITVSQSAFLRLGAVWGTAGTPTPDPGVDQTGLAVLPVTPGFVYNWTNVFGVKELTATLTALEQSGESQVLSAPRLTVVNNLPATINDGQVQYYYEEYQVKTQILQYQSASQLVPSGKPVKITAGASLDVLASIGGDGKTIYLALNPRVNSAVVLTPFATITDTDVNGRVVSSFDIKLPTYRTEDLATRVVVRSGQTVAMGGVLERQQVKYVESIPVLGNLPIIGAAFRRRTELDKPRYLLIFVTATVLDENGQYVVYQDEDQPAASADPTGNSGSPSK